MRTLARAEEIRRDPKRLKAAQAIAKEKIKELEALQQAKGPYRFYGDTRRSGCSVGRGQRKAVTGRGVYEAQGPDRAIPPRAVRRA